jgi:hypothetical protein
VIEASYGCRSSTNANDRQWYMREMNHRAILLAGTMKMLEVEGKANAADAALITMATDAMALCLEAAT